MWGFPASSAGKESTCNAGGPDSIPKYGREGNSNQLQYSCLENPMYRVHGVAKNRTCLSD